MSDLLETTLLVFPRRSSYITVILQIYKNLAEDVDINGNSSTDENSQQMALLMKSKSSFYQALDRLGSDRHEVGLMKGIGMEVIHMLFSSQLSKQHDTKVK